MGAVATPVNTTANTVDQIINFAFFKLALPTIEAAIVSKAPFLALPIISPIFKWIMSKLTDALYVPSANYANFAIITKQTNDELNAYQLAEANLRNVHLTGDPNAIALASAQFDQTLASLIHFDGSATPPN